MKPMFSAVAGSPARMRSPSFWSSSSVTTTGCQRASPRAASTDARPNAGAISFAHAADEVGGVVVAADRGAAERLASAKVATASIFAGRRYVLGPELGRDRHRVRGTPRDDAVRWQGVNVNCALRVLTYA